MPTPSTTITPLAGGSSSTGGGEEGPMSATSTSSLGSSFRFVPAFCLGVVAAVVFQLAWGGLSLTSFFLKLFIYVSFALLCFLAGSFVLLVRKSPLKVSCFDRNRRQSAVRLEFFNKLMVRYCYLLVSTHHSCRVHLWERTHSLMAPQSHLTFFSQQTGVHLTLLVAQI